MQTVTVGSSGAIEEIEHCRDQLREHFAQLVQQGRDPAIGHGWGQVFDSYDALIVRHADRAGVGLPPQPWRTNGERIAADEICRRAGIVNDRPLVPDVPPYARDT